MPRFRHKIEVQNERALTPEVVRQVIDAAMRPGHFFVHPSISLQWTDWMAEEIPWELYNGRLLDPAHTRLMRRFESRHVFRLNLDGISVEPLLSVRYDSASAIIHVTRGIDCFVNEGYDAGDSIFMTREVRKWVRELVGTIHLAEVSDADELRDELICRLFQAVVGTSRLPLTSIEAPLPEFSLGLLSYSFRSSSADEPPLRHPADLVHKAWTVDLGWLEQVKLLETLLRSAAGNDLESAAAALVMKLTTVGHLASLPRLLRALFESVSLTPYTDFVSKSLMFVDSLVGCGGLSVEQHIDFLSYILRQLGRHLTAYDLVTFHHRGANYPDALLLDAVIKVYLRLIERHSSLFLSKDKDDRKRIRRRALRQGWYFRRHYEGLAVPDEPTSPGENTRVLPLPHARVPDAQIVDTTRRTRRLFESDPLTSHLTDAVTSVLRQSIVDLEHPLELRELGLATFLDRPLGVHKRVGEPDQTPLLSYEAFSRSIARRRLSELADLPELGFDQHECGVRVTALDNMPIVGIAVMPQSIERPGRVSVADAYRVATDFILLRTTPRSVREFMSLFDWAELKKHVAFDSEDSNILVVGEALSTELAIHWDHFRKKLTLRFDPTAGYRCRGGIEQPASGLEAVRFSELIDTHWREHVISIPVRIMGVD